MPRKKKEVTNPEAETVVDTVEVTDEATEEATDEVTNHTAAEVWSGSFLTRTYTKEKHGDNFAELANEFTETNGPGYRVVLK